MKRAVPLITLGLMLVLGGCVAAKEPRTYTYALADVQSMVFQNMSRDEIRRSLGEPDGTVADFMWTYRDLFLIDGIPYGAIITFEDNKAKGMVQVTAEEYDRKYR